MRKHVLFALTFLLGGCVPHTPSPAYVAPPPTWWVPPTREIPPFIPPPTPTPTFVPVPPTVIVPTLAPIVYPTVVGTPIDLSDPANWPRVGLYYRVADIHVLGTPSQERLAMPGLGCAWELPQGMTHGDITANVALAGSGAWIVRVLQDAHHLNVIERTQVTTDCGVAWERVASGYAKAGILPDGVVVYNTQRSHTLRRSDDPAYRLFLPGESYYVFCADYVCVLRERGGQDGYAIDFRPGQDRYPVRQFTWPAVALHSVSAECEEEACWFRVHAGTRGAEVRVSVRGQLNVEVIEVER